MKRQTRNRLLAGGGVVGALLLLGMGGDKQEENDDNGGKDDDPDEPEPDLPGMEDPVGPPEDPVGPPEDPVGPDLPGVEDPVGPPDPEDPVGPPEPAVIPGLIKVLPPPPNPNDPTLGGLVTTYPQGTSLYQVEWGDRFLGQNGQKSIAYRYLLSEGYLAALDAGLDHEQALAWAPSAVSNANIRAITDIIQCGGWNDAAYAADKVAVSRAGPGGRSILLVPVHANNLANLREQKAPERNITMGGNPAHDAKRDYELLWLGAIDRKKLYDSGGNTISTEGQIWEDGSSKLLPPPWITDLGMDDNTGNLAAIWGCAGPGQIDYTP